jgi:hypothetical protein
MEEDLSRMSQVTSRWFRRFFPLPLLTFPPLSPLSQLFGLTSRKPKHLAVKEDLVALSFDLCLLRNTSTRLP